MIIGYYAFMTDKVDPLTGDPMPQIAPQTPLAPPQAFVPDMSDDELIKLSREQLSKALQHVDAALQPEMTRKLCAEVYDRLIGKATQKVETKSLVATIDLNEHKRQVRQQAVEMMERLARVAGQIPAVVTSPSVGTTEAGS